MGSLLQGNPTIWGTILGVPHNRKPPDVKILLNNATTLKTRGGSKKGKGSLHALVRGGEPGHGSSWFALNQQEEGGWRGGGGRGGRDQSLLQPQPLCPMPQPEPPVIVVVGTFLSPNSGSCARPRCSLLAACRNFHHETQAETPTLLLQKNTASPHTHTHTHTHKRKKGNPYNKPQATPNPDQKGRTLYQQTTRPHTERKLKNAQHLPQTPQELLREPSWHERCRNPDKHNLSGRSRAVFIPAGAHWGPKLLGV